MGLKSNGANCSTWLVLTTVLTSCGSSLILGYNLAVINTPANIIVAFYNHTYNDVRGTPVSDYLLHLLWAVTVSIYVAAGMAGAFTSGAIAECLGRKRGILFNHAFMFVGALLEGLSHLCQSPEMLIIGRLFVGFNSGMSVALASLYLTEIAPKEIRGTIGLCHQMAVTSGILLAQILGLKEALGTVSGWPILCGLSAIPALISAILLPFCPESPRYLLLKKGDELGAIRALVRLRGRSDVEGDIEEMRREAKGSKATIGTKFTIMQFVTRKQLRLALMVSLVLQVTQQWSGINAIFYYSHVIFENAGVAHEHIPYAIVVTGAVNVVVTIISMPLVEKLGRRPLLLWPMCLMTLSTIVITVSLNLQSEHEWMAYVSVGCIILFIIGFAIGLGPIPQLLGSELFRQAPRAAAMGISQGVQWTSNFILAISFKFLHMALEAYTFLVFMVVLVLCLAFIFFYLPETRNRTFDEIAQDLKLGHLAGPRSRMSASELLYSETTTPAAETAELSM